MEKQQRWNNGSRMLSKAAHCEPWRAKAESVQKTSPSGCFAQGLKQAHASLDSGLMDSGLMDSGLQDCTQDSGLDSGLQCETSTVFFDTLQLRKIRPCAPKVAKCQRFTCTPRKPIPSNSQTRTPGLHLGHQSPQTPGLQDTNPGLQSRTPGLT